MGELDQIGLAPLLLLGGYVANITAYYSNIIDNDKSVVIIGKDYKGYPALCYAPTVLITSSYSLNKYADSFVFDKSKTKIVLIDP